MLVFLLLSLAQDPDSAPATPFDTVLAIEIHSSDAVLEGHGRSQRAEYLAGFSGSLHAWTKVEGESDLFLRVETPEGKRVARNGNSGGGNTPYVKLDVEPGTVLVFIVALEDGKLALAPESALKCELHLLAAPETDATRASAPRARTVIMELERMRAAKDLVAARALNQRTIDELGALKGAGESELVSERLWELGYEAYLLSVPALAKVAWERTLRQRVRTLPREHPELQAVRKNLAGALLTLGDSRRARPLLEAAFDVQSRTLPEASAELQSARSLLAVAVQAQGDYRAARDLEQQVLEIASRTLPDDHPSLQAARQNLAVTLMFLGEAQAARPLLEKVLEVHSRILREDDPDLQKTRLNLAATLHSLGELQAARPLLEKALEVDLRTLPEEHRDLQLVRLDLGATLLRLGDPQGARSLFEQVLETESRTLSDDHPDLQNVRHNLALALAALDEFEAARELEAKVLEVRTRSLPDDHRDVQEARVNLAVALCGVGDPQGARALAEHVLEARTPILSDDHPDLQSAREVLAGSLADLGDFSGARALHEKVLEVRTRSLPDDHDELQEVRQGLAVSLLNLGDTAGARVLFEKVLEVRSRRLPDDHRDLQVARQNLGEVLWRLHELQGARMLEEKALEMLSRKLPADHRMVQEARESLAATIRDLGDIPGARAMAQQALDVLARALPDQHPELQRARQNLACILADQGDFAAARALEEQVLEVDSHTLPEGHPILQQVRENLALSIASQEVLGLQQTAQDRTQPKGRASAGAECEALARSLCRGQVLAARRALLEGSQREVEERCVRLARVLDFSISMAAGYGVFDALAGLDRESLVLSESTRGTALWSATLLHAGADVPGYAELRGALRQSADELASLARKGTTTDEFQGALRRREEFERQLLQLVHQLPACRAIGLEFDPGALAAGLEPQAAVVSLRRYLRSTMSAGKVNEATGLRMIAEPCVESLCAFVLTSGATARLTRIELGDLAPIEEAVHDWRVSLGVCSGARGNPVAGPSAETQLELRGLKLRRLLIDPLLPALQGATHVIVAGDDVTHLVPLDALPDVDTKEPGAHALIGDRLQIETRATLIELLIPQTERHAGGGFVVLGDAAYDWSQESRSAEGRPAKEDSASEAASARSASGTASRHVPGAAVLRGGAWAGGFAALPGTGPEVEGITACFRHEFGDREPVALLTGKAASRQALFELAPRARWLHVATHGWYAPESIHSWEDLEPVDRRAGPWVRPNGQQQVKGMSPMLLCGLALAGANLPENALGRAPGLVTAEEVSTLDLSNCELVVLSACDTNLGERRAGQGVHSLQMALQMAGARSVITSLWKVPDEATSELMLDFYRRLWLEKKPKWQALWEAKKKLREAKDETGKPKYTTRDWAAWVLTGDPE